MALNNLTLEEVRELASNTASCIRKTEADIVVLIHPMYAGDVVQGVNKELSSMSSRHSRDLGGIPMAFEKVRISSDGGIFHTNPFIHLRVHATFYVFSPEVGSVLEGSVKRKSPNHLSCLVHKTFNVSVPKPHSTPAQSWEGTSVEEGDAVRLVLSDVNMSFDLPMITGRLDGRIATASGNSVESSEEKPPNASVDSGISSEYDEDGEKIIKAGKKKEKKGDKKGKVKVVSKKKGVKDKVKAEKKKKKMKEREEREKTKKEKKKKKDDKEKHKKDKKGNKETIDEKQARKEKKKKNKEKKASKKEKKKSKSSLEGEETNGNISDSVKTEQSKGMEDEDYSIPIIKGEMNSPVKMEVLKGVIKKEDSNSIDPKQTILDRQIKVEACSDSAHNIPSTSGFAGDTLVNESAWVETGDFNDDDFFGRRKSLSKKIKKDGPNLSPSKDGVEVKKRKLEESPVKSKKKQKIES